MLLFFSGCVCFVWFFYHFVDSGNAVEIDICRSRGLIFISMSIIHPCGGGGGGKGSCCGSEGSFS